MNDVVQVTITVLNASNAGPVFNGAPYAYSVFGSTKARDLIGQISATDDWSRGADIVYYNIVPSNESGESVLFCCSMNGIEFKEEFCI